MIRDVSSRTGTTGLSREGRRSAALYPILAVGLTAAAYIAIRTGRDAAFFTRTGLQQLPAIYTYGRSWGWWSRHLSVAN